MEKLTKLLCLAWIALGLVSCQSSGSGLQGPDAQGAVAGNSPFGGRWTGTLQCDLTVNDNGTVSRESGQLPSEHQFDGAGSLILAIAGTPRTFSAAGQSVTAREASGSLLTTTLDERAVSDSVARYVVRSVSDDTRVDSSSNFSVHAEQVSSIQLTLGSDRTKATVQFSTDSDETTTFSSSFGSGVTQKVSTMTCTGEMTLSASVQ